MGVEMKQLTPLLALSLFGCVTASEQGPDIGTIPCGLNDRISTTCPVSVRADPIGQDNWFVIIERPDGLPRTIYFSENEPWGGDGAEADGSAAFEFSYQRSEQGSLISFGPERYVIPDAVIPGY